MLPDFVEALDRETTRRLLSRDRILYPRLVCMGCSSLLMAPADAHRLHGPWPERHFQWEGRSFFDKTACSGLLVLWFSSGTSWPDDIYAGGRPWSLSSAEEQVYKLQNLAADCIFTEKDGDFRSSMSACTCS